MSESELREAIVNRIIIMYPARATREDYAKFLSGAKASIDGWLGDAFAALCPHNQYSVMRKALFTD